MGRITVQINVRAELEKVWNCWTKAEHITQWNFATDEWCCPKAENDLTPNGHFSWRMEARDGSMEFDFEGTYEKIVPHKLISYTMSEGRKVDIEFIQHENEVTVKETFDAEGTHADELQRQGWQAILGNFKKYVEAN